MTKHGTMRQRLAEAIIAADIGWTEGTIVHKRTTSLWNAIATAVAAADGGIVLHIGVTSGRSLDDDALHLDIDMPITIICRPQVNEAEEPREEQLWEDLVGFMHGLQLEGDEFAWRFLMKDFQDIEIEGASGATSFFGRQTTFKRQFSL